MSLLWRHRKSKQAFQEAAEAEQAADPADKEQEAPKVEPKPKKSGK